MLAQMHLKGLMFDPYNNAYIVVLRDEDGQEMLPIWVGKAEAGAISKAYCDPVERKECPLR